MLHWQAQLMKYFHYRIFHLEFVIDESKSITYLVVFYRYHHSIKVINEIVISNGNLWFELAISSTYYIYIISKRSLKKIMLLWNYFINRILLIVFLIVHVMIVVDENMQHVPIDLPIDRQTLVNFLYLYDTWYVISTKKN